MNADAINANAREFITRMMEMRGRAHDIVSSGMTKWDTDIVCAVTVAMRTRAAEYEVWEVVYRGEDTTPGEGVFGCVARTRGGDDINTFDDFAYDATLIAEVA